MKKYTQTDLMEMDAGKLDDAVARNVMGWRLGRGKSAWGLYDVWKDHHGREMEAGFYPSSSGYYLLQVIKRLLKKRMIVDIWDDRVSVLSGTWPRRRGNCRHCLISGYDAWFYNDGNTAKAICCAAILAIQR